MDQIHAVTSSPYAVGDLQGCSASLHSLLSHLPSGTPLRFVGDLVNRGPASLETLRFVKGLGNTARTVLGNHDIHLLAVAAGVRKQGRSDTLDAVLAAQDCEELLTWLRHQPLAIHEEGFLIVHAGVLPQWPAAQVLELAAEVEDQLRGPDWRNFLANIFDSTADRWNQNLRGIERHRVIVNALTRLRFCTADGVMDLRTKDGVDQAPKGVIPWFDAPGRMTEDITIVCGHWSTLGLVIRPNLIALDTGCVWGGKLTAVQLVQQLEMRKVAQVDCPQCQDPLA